MIEKTSDLKPCPHCPKGKAIVGKDERYTWVRCNKCDGGTAGWHSATKKQQLKTAIDFWQNRPIEDELRSLLNENLDKHMNVLGALKKTKDKLVDAKDVLIDISQSAGNPDPKDACRIIIGIARRAIIDIESKSLW